MVQDECASRRSLLVRWNCKVPNRHNLHRCKALWNSCCPPSKRAFISWGDNHCFCYKRATISYVDTAPCPKRFPAYIRWAAEPKPCNKLVQIIWKTPEPAEKVVDLRWASDCAKKKVEICWVKETAPTVKTKEISVRWLTRRGDCCNREMVVCRPSSTPEDKRRPRCATTMCVCCGR